MYSNQDVPKKRGCVIGRQSQGNFCYLILVHSPVKGPYSTLFEWLPTESLRRDYSYVNTIGSITVVATLTVLP